MRLLFVVQRYGEHIGGGAEQHCRDFAERLVGRGHEVAVLTTCASSYVDWANELPPGISTLNGVSVFRVPTARPRVIDRFNALDVRMVASRYRRPLELQREWMRQQGPDAPALVTWLARHAHAYDCVIVITYLYWTARAALASVAGTRPVVLHPTAHDEPPLRRSLFDEVFRLADACAFLTAEESQLVAERFPGVDGAVVGVGVDPAPPTDVAAFRARFGLGDRPYLCYVGRLDAAKGATELVDWFTTYKNRRSVDDDLALVLVGQNVMSFTERTDIVVTGFVSDVQRDSAIAGALALVQPSYFESFSMVLTEAFALERPALVQRACPATYGHARRSGAALPYRGYGEFEAALDLVRTDVALAAAMGRRGRAYVEREYAWPVVLDRYEALLDRVVARSAIGAAP